METVKSGLVDQVFLRCVEDCLEPIMLTNQFGKLTYVNPAWVMTYGYSKEEAIGQTPRLLRSNVQSEEFYKGIWATILDPKIGFWKGELTNRAKDGHHVPVLLTITPYRESSDEIVGYMGIAMDLSEQKTMEQQLLHQDRMASVGLLAGGLAHEIGNPLGVIRGRAELVLAQVNGNEVAASNLGIILDQIDRISGLIQSLLRVSRGPDLVPLKKLNLTNAVNDVLVLTSEECRRMGVLVRTQNLDLEVLADAAKLQQVLLNIILNSLHAIEEQKSREASAVQREHFVEITAKAKDGDRCLVVITDSGCGIPKENLDKIFRPFFTTKEVGKGTGLGLAMVAKLVDEIGGKVSVHSEGPGTGARFEFEFQQQ